MKYDIIITNSCKRDIKKANKPIKKWAVDLNIHFFKEYIQIKIKSTVSFHLTLVRMTIIRKSINSMLGRVWRKRTLLPCWWECKLLQSLGTMVWRFLTKLKTLSPYDLTPGQIFGQNYNSNRYIYPNVHSSTVYNSQDMEGT